MARTVRTEVPGKSVEEVKHHYELLVNDIKAIYVEIPCYNSWSYGSTGEEATTKKGTNFGNSNGHSSHRRKYSKRERCCFLWGWTNAVKVTGKPFPVIFSDHRPNKWFGRRRLIWKPLTDHFLNLMFMFLPQELLGQPIGRPLVSTVGTAVNLPPLPPVYLPPPPHLAYGVGAPVHGSWCSDEHGSHVLLGSTIVRA
ncbi:hypothetical protein SASPL_133058 [Salvia splendens]|uniref:Uncharacterized protein n=1 Tax=Salvia splendens TaxID=180675 RepID=A0A8X8X4C8_SALSN|nr:hypothetical protein SASPL_133058 [Salvia splendens]